MKTVLKIQGWRSYFFRLGLIIAASTLAVFLAVMMPTPSRALTTVPTKMNFQGRLTNSTGTAMANGTYNMRFKIYNAASAGTVQWSEDRLVSASQGVVVTNGQFSVQLGSVNSLPPSIFTSNSLYFEVELPTPASATSGSPVWTELPMTPRNQLATSAYAYNAETLDGLDSADFGQLVANNTWSGTQTFSNTTSFTNTATFGNTVIAPGVDTASSGVLTLGSTNASSVLFAKDTVIAAGKSLTITGSGTRPSNPAAGTLYFDTTTKQLLVYSNGKWQADRATSTKIVAASNSSQAAKDSADYVADGNTLAALDGDQVQINAALSAAAGGRVYLLEGTYVVDASVMLQNKTALIGAGQGSIIEMGDIDTSADLIQATGSDGFAVQNMQLNGRRDLNTAGTQNGIRMSIVGDTNTKGISLNDLSIINFRNDGIRFDELNNSTIQNVIMRNNGGIGLVSGSPNENNTFSQNTAISNGSLGYDITMTGGSFVNNSAIANSGIGIRITSSSEASITGNRIVGNSINSGIDVSTSSALNISGNQISGNYIGIGFDGGTDTIISHNNIANNVSSGISLFNAGYYKIANNSIKDSGGNAANDAITIGTSSTNNTINANVITDANHTTTNNAITVSSTAAANYLSGNVLNGGAISDAATSTIYVGQMGSTGQIQFSSIGGLVSRLASGSSADLFQGLNNGGSALFKVTSTGEVNTSVGLRVNGTAGASTTCSGGQFMQNQTVLGGVITGGTCATALTSGTTQSFAGSKTFTDPMKVQTTTDDPDAFRVIRADGTTEILTVDTESATDPLEVQIGSNNAVDAVQINLALDSSSQFTDQGTCGTSTNQGSMYFNTTSNAVRMCINGAWEDMLTTGGLGLLAFGVVPDSANAGSVGDLAGLTQSNSPCKVYWSGAQQVTVAPCIAYSGGRKVTVNSTNLSTAAIVASNYVNVCLSGTDGAPALVGAGNAVDASAPKPTWNANNPILCLATLQISTTNGTITNGKIYDVRSFTTSTKSYATSNTAVNVGMAVNQSATANLIAPTSALAAPGIRGVVVAYSGTQSTTVANTIISTAGPQWVKATGTSAANSFVQGTATAGYTGTSTISAVGYANMGVATRTIDTTCTSNATCQYSQFLNPMALR